MLEVKTFINFYLYWNRNGLLNDNEIPHAGHFNHFVLTVIPILIIANQLQIGIVVSEGNRKCLK
ncbi:MAG: hypothetical protein K8S97_10945, partial [Anaerolineae bacterium]|nr:hypothetical protein [Anaerolineae bacterium]